jgi:thymidylate synthase
MSYAYFNFDQAIRDICHQVVEDYDYQCEPRGQKIRERLAFTFTLADPQTRLVHSEARNANYGFAVGEFLWYWQGRTDLEMMLYYNKRMASFSDDGKHLESAYGFRLRKDTRDGSGHSQWDDVIETLLSDADSRRAVMTIYSPADMRRAVSVGTKDVPCTLSLQFFIRNNCLNLHAVMRSNDVMWGLTYDLFSFTLLQECMLHELQIRGMKDLRLGQYHHTAGSLHIYENHFEMARKIYSDPWPPAHPAMPALTSIAGCGSLNELCEDEEKLRLGKIQSIDTGKYRDGELWMANRLNEHRVKRDLEKASR